MIIIDWISPPNHRNFNRALFSALELNNSKCIVFSKNLMIPEIEGALLPHRSSRFGQALEIFRLLVKYRQSQVLLLTYDVAFLPIALILKRNLLVWEHNTTPEKEDWLKGFWQRILFKGATRLAQFPGQKRRLLDLKQNVKYVGSPIFPSQPIHDKFADQRDISVYAAPSVRADLSYLADFLPVLGDCKIIVKNTAQGIDGIDSPFIIPVDWIAFTYLGIPLSGILITVNSEIRGSFWINEAIANNIPIIILNGFARNILKETFPDYPFCDLTLLSDLKSRKNLFPNSGFDTRNYVRDHNMLLKERFLRVLDLAFDG